MLVAASLLVVLPCEGQEGEPPPSPVSLEEAVDLFRAHSLELRAARAEARATAGRAEQAAAYPNPALSLFQEDLSRGTDDYSETTFNVAQTLEWPGRTLARSRAADRTREATRLGFRSDSLRLALEVRRAYLVAAEAEGRVEVLEEVAAVFREAVADGTAREAEGDVSGYDLRRLRLERARLEQVLTRARVGRDAARRELAGRAVPGSDTVALATRGLPDGVPPEVDRHAALEAALRRPSVAAARSAAEAAAAESDVARLERIPDLELTGGYKTQSDDFDGAVLGVSLSLPVFDRKGAAVQAAEASRSAADARLRLREREARNVVLRALDRYRSVRDRRRTTAEELLAPSTGLLAIARTAYGKGEMELVELLDGADAYLDARLTALDLRSELWLAYFELSRAMGGPAADTRHGEDR